MVTTSVGRTLTLASSQNSSSWSVIRSLISSSRIILTSCNERRDECCDENRFGRGFEFKVYLRGSRQGSVRVWFQVCIQVCPHAEREGGVRVLGNQPRVDKRECERVRVQTVHTSVALDKSRQVPTMLCSTHNEQLEGCPQLKEMAIEGELPWRP